MKALLKSLLFLLFFINANADLLPTGNTLTTTSATPTSTSTTPTSTPTSTTATSTSTTASHTTTSTSSSSAATSASTNANTSTTSGLTPVLTPVVTAVDGTSVTTVVTVAGSSSSTNLSSQPTSSAPPSSENSSSLGTGSIIGLSVAGGVAVIGLIAFFIWKMTRKRFSDFDDGEAIKWPDLNTHGGGAADSHPLPVHNTGRAGFDTGSEGELSRVNSNNYSTADFNSASDPYAVPPLPHLNPNQPYRDDPGAIGGTYYDPYRGPIPGTMEQGPGQEWSGEAIPMTQMNPAGRMSPGPNVAYSGEHVTGRHSPGPQIAYGGKMSQAPQAVYSGRMSPGPQAAYGASPSPVPPGYDAYGAR